MKIGTKQKIDKSLQDAKEGKVLPLDTPTEVENLKKELNKLKVLNKRMDIVVFILYFLSFILTVPVYESGLIQPYILNIIFFAMLILIIVTLRCWVPIRYKEPKPPKTPNPLIYFRTVRTTDVLEVWLRTVDKNTDELHISQADFIKLISNDRGFITVKNIVDKYGNSHAPLEKKINMDNVVSIENKGFIVEEKRHSMPLQEARTKISSLPPDYAITDIGFEYHPHTANEVAELEKLKKEVLHEKDSNL